jgi:fructose-bisphosphate aldolase class II
MMDGSLEADGKTVASYEYNVEVPQGGRVGARHRRDRGRRTGRAGFAGNHEGRQGRRRRRRHHDPRTAADRRDQAADFVKATQCDALAIAIGTSHGAYKFSRKPTGDILAIDRIKEIHARIPNTHLVMHGSSSVPQELLAEIREFGGDMKETYGVPVEEIGKASSTACARSTSTPTSAWP